MIKKFFIKLFGDDSERLKLNRFLPPIKDLKIINQPIDELEFSPVQSKGIPVLIWINTRSIRCLNQFREKLNQDGSMDNLITVGQNISSNIALILGKIGVQNMYDLASDSDGFVNKLLDCYEQWKSNITEDKSIEKDLNEQIIGHSEKIQSLRRIIKKVSDKHKLTVLIQGETGSGKGLVAKAIHDFGSRCNKPFIEINCTAIPDTLVEAELFGHEKGAFTDAHRSRRGIFELAHGGTLFLDEIGYLKPEIQVKLLKVLEEKTFRRIGGERDITVNCRVVTGTSVDLEEAVKTRQFRADLYYRLNVFPIYVPPLRSRGDDIILLADHFRKIFSENHGVTTGNFTPEAIDFLKASCWPGNVRELKHAVERAVILAEKKSIESEDLGGNRIQVTQNIDQTKTEDSIQVEFPQTGKSLDDIQAEIIHKVLNRVNGNKSEASRLLNISRSRLLRALKRFRMNQSTDSF